MRIYELLEELIYITRRSKTDFALSMNMTPSGLSKLLGGSRYPHLRDKAFFSKKAASYFADFLFCPGCQIKLAVCFPLLYDFRSRDELKSFLIAAFEYLIEKEHSVSLGGNIDYSDRGYNYLGQKAVLNMFCIIVSDILSENTGKAHEIFSNLSFLDPEYFVLFQRIQVFDFEVSHLPVFHYFVDSSMQKWFTESKLSNFLTFLEKAQEVSDCLLWKIDASLKQNFLLIRGEVLLTFSVQLDGSLMMNQIRNKNYLTSIVDFLDDMDRKKIGCSSNEMVSYLKRDFSCLDEILHSEQICLYDFLSLGSLITKAELPDDADDQSVQKKMIEFWNQLMKRKIVFVTNLESLSELSTTDQILLPLSGFVRLSPEQKMSYVDRLIQYLENQDYTRLKIIDRELPKAVILSTEKRCMLYIFNRHQNKESFYWFDSDLLSKRILCQNFLENTKVIEFNRELIEGAARK